MNLPNQTTRITHLSAADAAAVDRALAALWADPRQSPETIGSQPGNQNASPPETSPETSPETPPEMTAGAQVAKLLALLAQCPAEEPPANLTPNTLLRITDYEQRQRLAMQIQALAGPTVAFQWRELLTVAAVLLLGLSVLWPMLAQSRLEAQRVACLGRMGAAGEAINNYAAANAGFMPRQPTASWASAGMNTPTNQPATSNSANLYLLVRQRYIDPSTLACPANVHTPVGMTASMTDWPTPQAVPFSYQNQLSQNAPRLENIPTVVILADRNPLFAVSPNDPHVVIFRKDVKFTSASYLHNQRGQNTLMTNGAVLWRKDPVMPNNDNIWLARGVTDYHGTEAPSDEFDSFLVP